MLLVADTCMVEAILGEAPAVSSSVAVLKWQAWAIRPLDTPNCPGEWVRRCWKAIELFCFCSCRFLVLILSMRRRSATGCVSALGPWGRALMQAVLVHAGLVIRAESYSSAKPVRAPWAFFPPSQRH